jgi:hypothetical protein
MGIASQPTRYHSRARNDVLLISHDVFFPAAGTLHKKKAMKIIAFGLGLG